MPPGRGAGRVKRGASSIQGLGRCRSLTGFPGQTDLVQHLPQERAAVESQLTHQRIAVERRPRYPAERPLGPQGHRLSGRAKPLRSGAISYGRIRHRARVAHRRCGRTDGGRSGGQGCGCGGS